MTNEELYRQYLSGDTEVFEQLYLQMQGFIASVAKDAAQSFGCADKKKRWMNCAPKALWSFVSAFPPGIMTRNVEN